MRVLVARPLPAGARTAARLAERGHAAILAPVLTIGPTGAAPPAGPFDALVLTSANAAGPAATHGRAAIPVFAVGADTARAAREAGFANVTAGAGDAGALAALVGRLCAPPSRLLLAAGRDRKAEPERSLLAAGHAVAVWPVYAADPLPRLPEPARDALAAGTLDVALHYSRRSAATLRRLAEEAGLGAALRALRHLCLSADVAAALPDCPRVAVAAAPDEAALLALLDR